MTIRVALHHCTRYRYDRLISMQPQIVRLRPAPHCRTPILSYSLRVEPQDHFVNWQQDPSGNFLARFVFPKKAREFRIEVELMAEMTVINPFDFFIEASADKFPFQYEAWLATELKPFLETQSVGQLLDQYWEDANQELLGGGHKQTTQFVVELNQRLQRDIQYMIRMEAGVQTPEQTLERRCGSCRDTAWLLIQLLRRFGLAARFVSGYLIQLAPDLKPLDGPAGPEADFTDLHAWAEVYIPGAGWVGLDPTSGLLAGEGHIPLAATPDPKSAAPISGDIEVCNVDFDFSMEVTRIHEDPRVTKPYTSDQWAAIDRLGQFVDQSLKDGDVRLTMGGEPTFVSIDDMDGEEWNTTAVGKNKRRLSEQLIHRLRERFGPGGLLHFGQGKWYPGESLPRWSLACYWRKDGKPIWRDASRFSDTSQPGVYTSQHAGRFVRKLAEWLRVSQDYIVPAFEDVAFFLVKEQRLPVNLDPTDPKLKDPEERERLVRVFERGLNEPVGFVLPLRRQWWQAKSPWVSGPWPVRSKQLFLLPGDSPVGLRLPLDSLPYAAPGTEPPMLEMDPLAPVQSLPTPLAHRQSTLSGETFDVEQQTIHPQVLETAGQRSAGDGPAEPVSSEAQRDGASSTELSGPVIRTALCVECRDGHLYVFMPPVERVEDYLELVAAVEACAVEMDVQVVVEGYHPPNDSRIHVLKVTPDPGVIEVNTHPATSWQELADITTALYAEARQTRLGTEKFDLDGKHTGTGGGNHVVVGAARAEDSPFLRRPDLLKSLLAYWINHPSLSYLFSGRFIGPTSQAPRVDEGRRDALYELEMAFELVPKPGEDCPAWLVDRLFRNLLIDLTGNTHRAEFCIDKLFSPDSSSGRLGLVEFRGFEMPPHAEMSLTQQLLIRALIASFWNQPYDEPVIHWGTTLHDRYMLPHFVWDDFGRVIDDLQRRGFQLQKEWFLPHYEFRFPFIGELVQHGLRLELRTAIEPWYVLGEQPAAGGTVRFVDSSVERLQVRLDAPVDSRYVITCNGRQLPLHPTGVAGQYTCGVRYRAWQPASCLHPTIPVHTPLIFDIVDRDAKRSLGGCSYHVAHPAGRNYETFPVNANEAEARRAARFFPMGHTPGVRELPFKEINSTFPLTLDLRRKPKPE
ncbi:MAG: transglutaminase family protein [bacterium]|nr:transglutaminase family protein [bacterium]